MLIKYPHPFITETHIVICEMRNGGQTWHKLIRNTLNYSIYRQPVTNYTAAMMAGLNILPLRVACNKVSTKMYWGACHELIL